MSFEGYATSKMDATNNNIEDEKTDQLGPQISEPQKEIAALQMEQQNIIGCTESSLNQNNIKDCQTGPNLSDVGTIKENQKTKFG